MPCCPPVFTLMKRHTSTVKGCLLLSRNKRTSKAGIFDLILKPDVPRSRLLTFSEVSGFPIATPKHPHGFLSQKPREQLISSVGCLRRFVQHRRTMQEKVLQAKQHYVARDAQPHAEPVPGSRAGLRPSPPSAM